MSLGLKDRVNCAGVGFIFFYYFLLLDLKDSAHTKDLLTSVTDVGSMGTVE